MHLVRLVLFLVSLLALSGKSEVTVGELLGGEVDGRASGKTHGEEERVDLNGDLGSSLLGALALGLVKTHVKLKSENLDKLLNDRYLQPAGRDE